MIMNFCRRCGTELTEQAEGAFVCLQNHRIFLNATPSVGIFFLTDDNQVILSVRGIEPYKGKLDAFGGFIEVHESLEEALAREIKEETGLTPDKYETPQYLCSGTSPYLYDGETRTILGSLFWSRLKPGAQIVAADDVADVRPIHLKDIDFSQLSHQNTQKGIRLLQSLFT